ncbi:MAG TPA: lasso RiPP family leader peptide-containing protein [Polyangiaceae bacterium]|nr:lasso RiPP family leader peptide-containing protein [Polyangiaceae bacterium]
MTKQQNPQGRTDDSSLEASPRRHYAKPKLVEYGNVREFTRGPGGSKPDAKAGSISG